MHFKDQEAPKGHPAERRFFSATRWLTLTAVLGALAGAILMFWLGISNTAAAYRLLLFGEKPAEDGAAGLPPDEATVITLMDALDRFLIGIVLLFFAYGIYNLFIRPDLDSSDIGLPRWLHVERIGQLKQTLAEVILVVLFVLFLRVALQTFHGEGEALDGAGAIRFMLLPAAIVLLAASLRLARLNRKEDGGADAEAEAKVVVNTGAAQDAAVSKDVAAATAHEASGGERSVKAKQ